MFLSKSLHEQSRRATSKIKNMRQGTEQNYKQKLEKTM